MSNKSFLYPLLAFLILVVGGALGYYYSQSRQYHTGTIKCLQDDGSLLPISASPQSCRLGLELESGDSYQLVISQADQGKFDFGNYLSQNNTVITVRGKVIHDPEFPFPILEVSQLR